MGLLGEFMGAIRVFQRAFGMPVSSRVIPFFVVLGRGAMGVCRPFMFFSSSSM
jgi:hypothetical protein